LKNRLHYTTITPQLRNILLELMHLKAFDDFRLVGGTALSLQLGHRQSVDIDLFTDMIYGTADFKSIEQVLKLTYPYVDCSNQNLIALGKSFYVGQNKNECVKLDVYYTDPFIRPARLIDGIRIADVEEIIAMKMDVIARGGRKKDFWDLHELMGIYTLQQMLDLHYERYPIVHDEDLIKDNLTNFETADEDFEPICLRGKYWEFIKLDFLDFVKSDT